MWWDFKIRIKGRNIAEFSRGGIFKPSLQAEILKNIQEVELLNQKYRFSRGRIYKPSVQAEVLKNLKRCTL